jgi:hypothetical protein
MNYKKAKMPKKKAMRGIKSYLQHALRDMVNCYTIFNLELNKEEQTFSFNKSYKIRGIRMEDKKLFTGRYEFEDTDNDLEILIKMYVD